MAYHLLRLGVVGELEIGASELLVMRIAPWELAGLPLLVTRLKVPIVELGRRSDSVWLMLLARVWVGVLRLWKV